MISALEGSLGKGHEGAHILEKAQEAMKSGDQKEGFTITRDTPRDHKNYHRRAHGENQMPREDQAPGLRALGEESVERQRSLFCVASGQH